MNDEPKKGRGEPENAGRFYGTNLPFNYQEPLKQDPKRKRIEVTIAVWVNEDADVEEVVSEMDYELKHPDILDTEVMGYEEPQQNMKY